MYEVTPLPAPELLPAPTSPPTPWRTRGSKGAASELIACVHLMRKGWHVFRSESPSCPFDLVAYLDGRTMRVEVKSINWGGAARVGPSVSWPTNDEWDLLLVVDPDSGACVEIGTHDPVDGRNVVRAAYGFESIEKRRTRAEVDEVLAVGRVRNGAGIRG